MEKRGPECSHHDSQKKSRLWFYGGSCVRLRPQHRNHVWTYYFLLHHTADGRTFWRLAVMDEYTRQCLAIDVARRMNRETVMERFPYSFSVCRRDLNDLKIHPSVAGQVCQGMGEAHSLKLMHYLRITFS